MHRVDVNSIVMDIDELRKQRGITQSEFARMMNKDVTFWSSIMYNQRKRIPGTAIATTVDTVVKALDALGYEMVYMRKPKEATGEDNPDLAAANPT